MAVETIPAFGALVNLARECGYDGPSDSVSAAETFAPYLATLAHEEPEKNSAVLRDVPGEWAFGLRDPVADADLPPITYRDRNRLWPDSPAKTVSQVIAEPKHHKTNWVMAELFRLAIAAMTNETRVLMLALEGAYGVRTMRLKALAQHYHIPLADLRGRFQIVEIKSGGMFDMSNPECVITFADFVKAGGWTDVFIDTQHRSAGALEENSATDARLFWNAVEVLRHRGNCNVVLAHHKGKSPGKDGRGSSADKASVDQLIELDFDRSTMTVAAKVTARKDGVDGFEVPFKVHQASEHSVPILEVITASEAAALVAAKETYTGPAVASVLAALEVVGQSRAVQSRVLVQEILVRRRELPEDATLSEKAINNGVKRLQEAVKKDARLQAYGRKEGTGTTAPWLWYLPETAVEAWPQ